MKEFIEKKDLDNFKSNFEGDRANLLAMNAVTSNGVNKAALNVYRAKDNQNSFSIEVEAGKVCDQKQSGRCWMFAAYNVFRLEIMEKLNLENMELSQNYPLFYDKLEKANYFLENILDTLEEKNGSRVVDFLLTDPIGDGGQWDMFRSITYKYGCLPKDLMPETAVSSCTRELNTYLRTKLRGFACQLREDYAGGKDLEKLRQDKEEMMSTIYRMLSIALGQPPERFSWGTRDKDKNFVEVKDITPQEFFREYVGLNLDDMVTVINAPTEDKPYGKTFTVQYLGSVRGGKYPVKYLNLPMEELKRITIAQLKDNRAVWFGSDVGQFSDRKGGYLTLDALKVEELFATDFPMNKGERLVYGESLMTHAMVITGVELDQKGEPIRWKVENSWGKDSGMEGFYVMSDEWFSEYAYQILLDKKYLTEEEKKQFEAEPILLKPWDPMGSLAR